MIGNVLMTLCLLVAAQPWRNDLKVYNKGIGGNNTRQGKARYHRDVIALKPDFVFIYFGLNDTLNEPAFVPAKEFESNLGWMVEEARKAGIVPVLCTIQHVQTDLLLKRHKRESYGDEGPNGKIDRYNAAIRRFAVQERVLLTDFGENLDRAGGPTVALSPDGVHLTPAGYRILAESFFGTVASRLRGTETIVCFGDSVTTGVGVSGTGSAEGETYPAFLRTFPPRPR